MAEDAGQGPGFVHLRVRSAYSLLEGALPIKRLVALAVADAMPALAICDTGNLFGALEFACTAAEAGVQPIIGLTLAVDMGDEDPNGHGVRGAHARPRRRDFPALALIARSEAGYRNLMRLSSRAFLDTDPAERPHVRLADLEAHAGGLVALTGGPGGPLNAAIEANRPEQARARAERLGALYGDGLYVELQRHGLGHEQAAEPVLIELAYSLSLPLVASNDAFFPTAEDFEAHDALLCIAQGALVSEENRRRLTPEHRFKTRAEMRELFSDLPEALASSVEIARRSTYWPRPAKPMLPKFAGGEGDEDEELKAQARAGLAARIEAHGTAPGHSEQDYAERLESELEIIAGMRYSGYFLIVSDFIKWAKAQSIPVGPGRGSGAGSLVAWSLTVTDLDPIRFGLLFERFLNAERMSMPDFDIDFCQDRRDEVIRYVQQRYGRDQVAQIITFGTLQARAVLRDVGRVLEMRYGEVDALAKMVPYNPANPVSLAAAIEGEPRLQEARSSNPLVAQLLRIALRLEGLYRHASTHAAGIVIGERSLNEIVPLYRDPRSELPVTQFSMKWVEQAGLVKFDFLGLKTLTVIDTAVKLLARRGVDLDISKIPLDDPPTYRMLADGATAGVFQFESSGMRDLLIRAVPSNIEDLIALVALFRPGPMENIPKYLACKHGTEKPEFLHETIEPVVADTYGVIIYQEQVMQIAQVFAGFALAEADILRHAMGKKIKAQMARQRARFIDGAVARGVARGQAEHVFDLVDKFAGYGFNKSHSAAYALIAYQTAYLKAHFPAEFLAASMTLDINNTDKLNDFRREAERLNIRLSPPSINASGVAFEPDGETIHYSLAAIKTVGRQAVEHIVAEREKGGPFRDLADFAHRVSPRMINRRALENLTAAGAFDALEPNRAALVAGADTLLVHAAGANQAREQGQNELFGDGADVQPIRLPAAEPWLPMERLTREFEAVGFFLSGHPLDDYMAGLRRMGLKSWGEFQRAIERGESAARLAGTVVYRQERRAKSGNRFAFVGLSDPSGQYEAVVFADTLAVARHLLEPGQSVLAAVEADLRGGEVRLRLQSVEPLDAAAAQLEQRGLRIVVADASVLEGVKSRLPEPGHGEIDIVVPLAGGRREAELRLPGRFRVNPEIAGAIRALPGVADVHLR